MDTRNVESEIQACVTSLKTVGQVSLNINRKHLLDASLSKIIAQKEIPLYRFAQQPSLLLWPFSPLVDIKHSQISGLNMPLEPFGVAQPVTVGHEAPIMAIPLSCITPEGFKLEIANNHETGMYNLQRGSHTIGIHQLSYSERKENWYIRYLPRSNGRKYDPVFMPLLRLNGGSKVPLQRFIYEMVDSQDWLVTVGSCLTLGDRRYYVHVRTNKQFRSLKEVYDFVMHGKLPIRNPKGKKGSDLSPRIPGDKQKRIRGDTLINKVGVGIYNLTKEKILRTATTPTASCSVDSNSSNIGTESKKRKRVEESSVQQISEENSPEVNLSDEKPDILYNLYDMEPKQKKQ